MAIPNSENGDSAARKRNRRDAAPEPGSGRRSFSAWRTESVEKRYSSKLLEALRRIRDDAAEPLRSRAVRDAADRALAVAARGRSRWSRAILSRRAIKLRAVRRRGMGELPRSLPHPMERRRRRRRRRSELVRKKAEELGRLVPGCRQVSLPALLEETSDYIAALEMQIRAMSVIADAVSSAGGRGS